MLQEVWGPAYRRETNYLRVHLAQLCRKLAVLEAWPKGTEPDRDALGKQTGLGPRRLGRILNLVDEAGRNGHRPNVVAVIERAEAYRKLQESRIERMRAYAETSRCRRQFLLEYFGEQPPSCAGTATTAGPGLGPMSRTSGRSRSSSPCGTRPSASGW